MVFGVESVAHPREGIEISHNPSAPVSAPNSTRGLKNLAGIGFMLAGYFFYSLADTTAKLLSETLHPMQIVWVRMLGLLTVMVVLLLWRGRGILRTKRPVLQLIRGLIAAGSATCFIFAVTYVPLADAVAVSFVAPFMVTALGALVLKEPVGIRRWTAISVGFMGTLIIIRPGMGVLHPAVFLVVAAASLFAFRQILSRMISGLDSTSTTIAYTAIVSVVALSFPLPFFWQTPETTREIYLLVAVAVLAAAGELMVIRALDIAMAVVLAPLQYSLIIWGTLWGFLVFSQLPDIWTVTGAAVIVASGFYTFHRERTSKRRAAKQPD